MAKKSSTLVLWKDYVLLKKFDGLLWMHQYKMVQMQECICEDVSKCVSSTKGITYSAVPSFLRNNINGYTLLAMYQNNFKDIDATQVG